MAIKIVDRGFKKYENSIKQIQSSSVKVGLFAKVGDRVLTKGIVNEFGTSRAGKNRNVTIPERSFIRATYNKNFKKVKRRFDQIFKSISKNPSSVSNKLKLIGIEQEKATKDTMTDLKSPANSPRTIAIKGSSNPLIDTGELRSKISSEVVRKNAI